MLKEVIGKIKEAEALAESIEREAFLKAKELLLEAELESQRLKSSPSKEATDRAAQIIKDAQNKAESLLRDKKIDETSFTINQKSIDEAVDAIVNQFLEWGL